MANEPPRPHWWHRAFRLVTATRTGAWISSHLAHRLDHPLYRLSGGRHSITAILTGLSIVLLITTGAKSGKRRMVPLLSFTDGAKVVLIASNFGRPTHPAWYYNLRARPEAELSMSGQTGKFVAYEALGNEREVYWQRAIDLYAGYASYQKRASARKIPVMVLEPRSELAFPPAIQSDAKP